MADWDWLEKLNAPETEEEQLEVAIGTMEYVLDPEYPMWAELKALSAELSAQTDELNQKIALVEKTFAQQGMRPCWVPMGLNPKGLPLFLCWTGEKLMVETCKEGKRLSWEPILKTTRQRRMESVKFLSKLYEAARVGQGASA